MIFIVKYSTSFKKRYRLMIKRGLDISLLDDVVEKLANCEQLDAKYQDHILSGKFKDCHECHIKPDWLLIYYFDEKNCVLNLVDTGTHSDLF